LKIGQTAIKSPQDVLNASFFLTAGENIPVVIWRGDKELTLQAEPAERSNGEYRIPGLQAIPTSSANSGDITLRLR